MAVLTISFKDDPEGKKQIRDYEHFMTVLNHLITIAPHWSDKSKEVGMVGLPINAILDWPMGTPSGFAFFLDPEVNAMIKKVLNRWGKYLQTEDSAQVLGTHDAGWFSKDGHESLQYTANAAAGTDHKFEDMFQCDPKDKYHGFKSWDGFFTRQFKEGIRPVAGDDSVIVAPCESKPYNYAYDCKLRDKFWIKGEPIWPKYHSCQF